MAKRKIKLAGNTFGARYGKKQRLLYSRIIKTKNAKITCPYCKYVGKVQRLASGIWYCTKCNSKYTAKAYSGSLRK